MCEKLSTLERRLNILSDISRQRKVTMPELAAKYGVSTSTIIRDVGYLSSLAPIYTKNGKNGGVFILATREHKEWLSDEEILFLNSLVDLVDNHGKQILRNIIDKFSQISPFDLLCSNL